MHSLQCYFVKNFLVASAVASPTVCDTLISDQVTQVVRKYLELASDSECRSLQNELDMFLTLPVINNECLNLGRPTSTCSQDLRSRDVYGNGIPNGNGNPMGIPREWE